MALAVIVAGLALNLTTFAQANGLRVQIPFDFYVSDTLMPAGNYLVSTLQNGRIIQLISNDGHPTMFAMSGTTTRNVLLNSNRVVFNRYGDANFLAELHWSGTATGREIRATQLELEARNRQAPTRVAIVPR
jgi:hypothetical protein